MADSFTGYTNLAMPQTSLADMMNMASGVQQYQQAQQMNPLALQKAAADLQTAQANAKLATGTVDPKIAQQQAMTSTSISEAEMKKLESLNKVHQTAAGNLLSVAQKENPTYDDLINSMTKTLDSIGASPEAKKNSLSQIPDELKTASPAKIKLFAAQEGTKSLSASDRFSQLFPESKFLATGGETLPVQGGNPAVTGVPAGTVAGKAIPNTFPVTTPIINPNGTPGYMGAPGNMQAALTPAQTAASTGAGEAIASDWKQTQADASSAQSHKAIFQTMKSLVPTAYTGLAADKKLLGDKILDFIGASHDTAAASSTEELAKNQNLLALVGGNTDSARQLAQIANPNVSMTKEGINKVINQLLSFEEFKTAKANYLNGLQSNPVAYGNRLQQWQNAADPRFFQEMTPQEFAALKKSSDYADLMKKRALAKQYGIIQ